MGHDTHFLERLERVDLGQAERALGLYRNPELVSAVLSELEIPERMERIAIALEDGDPRMSPHVIVSRDGHFVTCLAAGMSVGGEVPRVTRPQLEGVRARHERLNVALEVSESRRLRGVLRRLTDDSEFFVREDAEILTLLHPLLGAELVSISLDLIRTYYGQVEKVVSVQSAGGRRRGLAQLWSLQWMLGVVIAGSVAQGPPLGRSQEGLDSLLKALFSFGVAGAVQRATGARVLWAMGRIARHALPKLKKIRAEALGPLAAIQANLLLGFVGFRHAKLRAEVAKVIAASPSGSGMPEEMAEAGRPIQVASRDYLLKGLADPDAARVECARELAAWRASGYPGGVSPDETSEMLYLSVRSIGREGLAFPIWAIETLSLLPWIAGARFEDLFFKNRYASSPPSRDELETLLRRSRSVVGRSREPVRAGPSVGRNDPCACGSGKKSKRCCAA